MTNKHCENFGYNADAIAERLSLLDLGKSDYIWSELLYNKIITPNIRDITEAFYDKMIQHDEFVRIIKRGYSLEHLKHTQSLYLLSLGVDFDSAEYFEERLRVGLAHARAGVSPSLYQSAFRVLQQLLLDYIPSEIKRNKSKYEGLLAFILKITMLDMSLAIETYHIKKVQKLEHTLLTLRNIDADLRYRVATDNLTGAASHEQALSLLRQALHTAQRNDTPLCISMVDLDHFKKINDAHGHLVGDDVLRDVVSRMTSAVRNFDSVGRYGGEEFVIILEMASVDTAQEICERVRQRVCDSPLKVKNIMINMSISQGLAEAQKTDNANTLLKRADAALYEAKAAGRNCVIVADNKEKKMSPAQSR